MVTMMALERVNKPLVPDENLVNVNTIIFPPLNTLKLSTLKSLNVNMKLQSTDHDSPADF